MATATRLIPAADDAERMVRKGLRISVVIPLYNEEESIPHLQIALSEAMAYLRDAYEVVIVDDGSKDRGYQLFKLGHGG